MNDPYPSTFDSQRTNTKVRRWISWGGLFLFGFSIFVCCGCGGLITVLVERSHVAVLKQQFAEHEVVRERIGELQTVRWDMFGSMSAANEFDRQNVILFQLQGSVGDGEILANRQDDKLERAILITGDGEFQLTDDFEKLEKSGN